MTNGNRRMCTQCLWKRPRDDRGNSSIFRAGVSYDQFLLNNASSGSVKTLNDVALPRSM